MRVDVQAKQSKRHSIATAATAAAATATVAAIAGVAFLVFSSITTQDGVAAFAGTRSDSSTSRRDIGPALLEPALRSLDGVTHHG